MTDSSKQRAAAEFKKAQRDDRPMTAYESEAVAIRAKTERLKALRLARDAAAPPAAPKATATRRAKPAAKGKTKKEAGGTLAQWLEDRQKDGHG